MTGGVEERVRNYDSERLTLADGLPRPGGVGQTLNDDRGVPGIDLVAGQTGDVDQRLVLIDRLRGRTSVQV